MTVQEAILILKNQKIPVKPTKCIEYTSCYVFHFGGDKQLDFSFMVDKNTSNFGTFNPFMISPEEYNNPIKIYNFNSK